MVREVQRRSAVGMDWTHPDFRASAMSEDGTVYGFVEPRRGIFREQDRLLFTNTPFSTRLDSGTVVLTSGVGGVFPRGIAVGRIVEEAEAEGGWRTSYWLEPYVQPGDLVHVLVARGPSAAAPVDTASPGAPASPPEVADDGMGPAPDLSAAWPPELRGTRGELEVRMDVALDSLAVMRRRIDALRDSLAAARGASADSSRLGAGGGEA
jgi:rod shape-determining protein MreC